MLSVTPTMFLDSEEKQWSSGVHFSASGVLSLLQCGVTEDCADSHMDLITITPDDGHLVHSHPLCLVKISPSDAEGWMSQIHFKLKEAE